MAKFKIGDIITAKEVNRGFQRAVVTGFTKIKNKDLYVLKISRGVATIPIAIEDCYEIVNN